MAVMVAVVAAGEVRFVVVEGTEVLESSPASSKRRHHAVERSAGMESGLEYQPSWAGRNRSKRTKNISRSQAKVLVSSPAR